MLLKDMETVVEDYYNSGLFSHQIGWMLDQEQSVFSFSSILADGRLQMVCV